MEKIELFFYDLTPEAQKKVLKFLKGDNGNYDVIPIITLYNEGE